MTADIEESICSTRKKLIGLSEKERNNPIKTIKSEQNGYKFDYFACLC